MIWAASAIFFHNLWYGDEDNLLHGALLNAPLWDQSHSFNDLVHDFRNVLNRHLRLAIWTEPPKITILAYISQFLSRRVDIECVRGMILLITRMPERDILIASANVKISLPTLTPPAMYKTLLVDADGA